MNISISKSFQLILRIVIASTLSLAFGQSPADPKEQVGTVNGNPIVIAKTTADSMTEVFLVRHKRKPVGPEDRKELELEAQRGRCSEVRQSLEEAARAVEKVRLGVVASDEDIAKLRREMERNTDAERTAATGREMVKALLAALTDVYEHGKDPAEAYQSLKQKIPVFDESIWTVYLDRGKSPEYRAGLTRQLGVTAERIRGGVARMDLRPMAENLNLNRAVDDEIAGRDSTFRTYLTDPRTGKRNSDPGTRMVPTDQWQYMNARRAEYWKAKRSQLQVSLNDSGMATRCALADLGVRVSGSPNR